MIRNKIQCSTCFKLISASNHTRHETVCVGLRTKKIRGVDYDPNAGYATGARVGKNQYTKAQELRLERPSVSKETREKHRLNTRVKNLNESEFTRAKRKETIAKKIDAGEWHISLAKKMHHSYKGVNLHGRWELAYAKHLDECNIPWERCKQVFVYLFEGKELRYTPDFFLPQTLEYIEIKGYKVPKDEAKWHQFPKDLKLKVLMKQDLKDLNII